MKRATDFRRIARTALQGKWALALAVTLVAVLLGGTSYDSIRFNFEYRVTTSQDIVSEQTAALTSEVETMLVGGFLMFFLCALLITLAIAFAWYMFGSIIQVGYTRFNLELVDGQDAAFNKLFAYFPHWKTTAAARLLVALYVFLWTLLFIVPGIIATYSYALTRFILAEHPELRAGEALARSKTLMRGNRWRLFCLEFSFIGWDLLCLFSCGIGNLWLQPYKEAAYAAFYREVAAETVEL